MKNFLLYLGCLLSIIACQSRETIQLQVGDNATQIDTLYLSESITERSIATLALDQEGEGQSIEVAYPTTGLLQTKNREKTYLVTLTPGKRSTISIAADSTLQSDSKADSLLNYLWKSSNNFIAENGVFIFNTDQLDSILLLFENFRKDRKAIIDTHKTVLTTDELAILHYQNEARIYSFLFYFGRLAQRLPAGDPFFKFIQKMNVENPAAKTLPHNILYKYEINYLQQRDSLQSIAAFMDYIAEQTESSDLADFYQAMYLKELMESPSYWSKHTGLFDVTILQAALAAEEENPYYFLLEASSSAYFASQQGELAYDFEAVGLDSTSISLSDLKGKLVFIDNWATWCGPCLSHRPKVLEMAAKYQDHPGIQFLMISLDATQKRWKNFFEKEENKSRAGQDLIIENGMQTEYGDRFNIRFIPKYVLIDEEGKIINADLPEPGVGLERIIEAELSKRN